MDIPTLIIGSPQSAFLSIQALHRTHPTANDYWDGNWVECDIEIASGAFTGKFRASLRCEEFLHFDHELEGLLKDLKGKATFSSMEEWLEIHAKGDGLGHFTAECKATDYPGGGRILNFDLEFDQTQIEGIRKGLANILQKFPVVGSPNE